MRFVNPPLLKRHRFLAGSLALPAGVGFARSLVRAQTLSWKLGFGLPPDHSVSVRLAEACAKVRKETNGRLDIKLFANNVLGGTPAMFTQLRVGALEMLGISGAAIAPVAVASIEQMAYAFPNRPTVFKAMDGDLGAHIRSEFQANGFVALDRVFDSGFRHFTMSNHPVRTPDDLQGVQLRVVAAKLTVDTFKSLGASPVGLSGSEIYTALQTHVVDGQEGPLASIESFRFFEVQKYLSLSHHSWNGYWLCINNAKWNALSRNLQETIRTNFNAAALLQRRDNEVQETSLRDILHRQGMAINDVNVAPFKAKLVASGYYGRWRDAFGSTAWSALEKYAGRLG